MAYHNRTLLQIPQGTEGFHLEEAYIHRKIIATLQQQFTSWGYLPAQIPVFDFYDTYRSLLSSTDTERVYRLIDRDGDLLMLRSDITLFLAKHVGTKLLEQELPLRIWYADTILRYQDKEDISKNEFFQTGAELIGKQGMEADLEVLSLLIKTLILLKLPGIYLHIGSRALFTAFFDSLAVRDQTILRNAVIDRDIQPFFEVLSTYGWKEGSIELVSTMFRTIGSKESVEELLGKGLREKSLPESGEGPIRYLIDITGALEELGLDIPIRIDFSEIGTMPYHTGIVFQVYMEELDSAIASGGRYDTLLGFFGFDTPSVGFSFLLRKVEHIIRRRGDFSLPSKPVRVTGDSFLAKLRRAEQIRADGGVAIL